MKYIIGFVIGLTIGTMISTAYAKYESSSAEAKSIVAYGYNGSTLVPIKVDSNGVVQIN